MNAPPSGGKVTATPDSGEALKTYFIVGTLYWSDDIDDMPLSYVFSYFTDDSTASTTIKAKNANTQVNVTFGQGLETMDYIVTCVVFAYDILGDSNEAAKTITVTPIVATVTELNSLVTGEVETAMKTGDTETVNNVLSGTLSSLNSADCSLAPNCTVLFREQCAHTEATCGACKEGYTGTGGGKDANTQCFEVDITEIGERRRLFGLTDFAQNRRILSTVMTKSCPLSCSGNGVCLYYGANDEILDTCLET